MAFDIDFAVSIRHRREPVFDIKAVGERCRDPRPQCRRAAGAAGAGTGGRHTAVTWPRPGSAPRTAPRHRAGRGRARRRPRAANPAAPGRPRGTPRCRPPRGMRARPPREKAPPEAAPGPAPRSQRRLAAPAQDRAARRGLQLPPKQNAATGLQSARKRRSKWLNSSGFKIHFCVRRCNVKHCV